MTEFQKEIHIPNAYHPNMVELSVDDAREQALQSLGLAERVRQNGIGALNSEEAAQVGQAMTERLDALASNINQQSE